jgi:hypothetical protein
MIKTGFYADATRTSSGVFSFQKIMKMNEMNENKTVNLNKPKGKLQSQREGVQGNLIK